MKIQNKLTGLTFGLVSALALATTVCAKVPVPVAKNLDEQTALLRDDVLKSNVSYDYLAELTTRFGPRLAGSDSERNAANWAAEKLKSMGFANAHVETFPLYVWSRGAESIRITAPFPQPLVGTALGQSHATPIDGIEAECVMFDTYAEFLASSTDVKGKIVVVLQPMAKASNGSGYGRLSGTMRSQGPVEAQKRGAVGYIMRTLSTDNHRFAHTGTTQWQENQGVPAMAISAPDASALSRIKSMQGRGEAGPLRIRFTTGGTFEGKGTSQNVVADIVGSEQPDQMIVIGGHMDSWDLGTGAFDDGAGQAITIAAAKAILDHGWHPKRTIRIVLWGSEEVSQPDLKHSPGGYYYAQAHKAEIDKVIITGESDFGADRVYAMNLPKGTNPAFVARIAALQEPLGVYIDKDTPGGGSDTEGLVEAGVPAIDLKQDGYRYFDIHHTADDVLDRIDRDQMSQNVAAWAVNLWMIANTDVDFRSKSPDSAAPAKKP